MTSNNRFNSGPQDLEIPNPAALESAIQEQDLLDAHIKKILIPRVSGTQGNIQVRQYIVDELQVRNYHVELDEFTDSTPIGDVNFANIIASSDPNACHQLVLACHYDSKLMDGFLGAIDSAVPCAMLLELSRIFERSFRPTSDKNSNEDLGLRFIFFDGEEAFENWTSTDSLYGSRHLAAKWQKQPAPQHCPSSSFKNELSRIELFVLLDLIGTSDTSFVMYNRALHKYYIAMQRYERDYFANKGLWHQSKAFKNNFLPIELIEDDHVPFHKLGVPILSLLAHPFPSVWHTIKDDYSAIDLEKTKSILHVLKEFVSDYMKLRVD